MKYMEMLMSLELFVLINLNIWGSPEIINNIAGK